MFNEYVLDGKAYGAVANQMMEVRFDPGLMRPYKDTGSVGRTWECCTVNTGRLKYDKKQKKRVPIYEQARIRDLYDSGLRSPVWNATSLPKESWIELDRIILRAARFRLRAWADLAKANTYGGFNGMGKMILEHETMSDPGEAIVDMDAITEGRTDSPTYQLQGLPLTITHSDFWFSERRLAISQTTGMPLSTVMGEAAGRRVAESIEKVTIGVDTGITYGGNSTQVGGYGRASSVYGYLNFPPRLIKNNLTLPTAVGWTPQNTLNDFLAMRDQLTLNKFFGPFMVYHSNDWDQYLDRDYILTGGNVATQTLRKRLLEVGEDEMSSGITGKQIQGVRRLDFLTASVTAANDPARIVTANPFTLIMAQMTQDVARAVNGQDITTIQWPSIGGMRLNFKVIAIQVPQLRADYYNNCGILVAT